MDLLADVSIAEAKDNTKSTGQLQATAKDTEKQGERTKPKPRPKWNGKYYMITFIAGRCATCRQHGPLNATCSTCPSIVSETPKYLPMSPPKRGRPWGRHQSKATKSLKVLESRKRTAKKSFRQWLETSFDVQSAHEHERLRITDLFQRYSRYCHQNKHERLMSLRSKIKEFKFTANILEKSGFGACGGL